MKAIIVAAGYGTRLGEVTQDKAKPLLKVGTKPILEHIINKIKSLDQVEQIFVVTNNKYYSDFISWLDNSNYDNIKIINDGTNNKEERLGSVGDINFVLKEERIYGDLLIIGGDNLFEEDLTQFINFFEEKGSAILLKDVKCWEQAKKLGIVSLNEDLKIINFVEKPQNPPSTLASTFIYALKKEHLPVFEEAINAGFHDRAGDFIKYLSEKEDVFGLTLSQRWFDIGSIEALKEAEEFYNEN